MNFAAIVPALNPDETLLEVLRGLLEEGFAPIYVVNDGSDAKCNQLFAKAAQLPCCTVLSHGENRGKGRALKTAIARYLQDSPGANGLVTVDADGQHSPADAAAIAREMQRQPNTLVLGCRDFGKSHVPWKNAIGNRITRTVFRLACGYSISDTQTGLRGIPNAYARHLLQVDGERYEFETNMLLASKKYGIAIAEVSISTIYINNNQASHFRPWADSLRIYYLIFKYAFSSLLSSVVDIGLFIVFNALLSGALPAAQSLLAATVLARLCSALLNFAMNRALVFNSKRRVAPALLRYAGLAAAQMLASYGGVYLLSVILPLPAAPAKVIVDLSLFFISFQVQRRWVFYAGNIGN